MEINCRMFKNRISRKTVSLTNGIGKDRKIGLAWVLGAALILLCWGCFNCGVIGQIASAQTDDYSTVQACFSSCVQPIFGNDRITGTLQASPTRPTQTPIPTLPPSGTPRPTSTTVSLPSPTVGLTATQATLPPLNPIFQTATQAKLERPNTPTVEDSSNGGVLPPTYGTAISTTRQTFTVTAPSGLLGYNCPPNTQFLWSSCARNSQRNLRVGEIVPIRTDQAYYCNLDTVTGYYRILVADPPRWVAWKNRSEVLGIVSGQVNESLCPASP